MYPWPPHWPQTGTVPPGCVVVVGGTVVVVGGLALLVVVVLVGGAVPPGIVTTYNSPVESLVMKIRPLSRGSQASPVGRKQPLGHALLFGFCITRTSAVLLFRA